jgi:hypothetical protein
MKRKSVAVLVISALILSFCSVSSAVAVDRSYYSDDKGEEQLYDSRLFFKSSNSESGLTYDVREDNKVVLLSTKGVINFSKTAFFKSGDSTIEGGDKYGTNAAVVSCNDSKIRLTSCAIETDGKKAHGVFAYHNSTIRIEDTTVQTKNNDSYNVVVSEGGTFTGVSSQFTALNKSGLFLINNGGEISVRLSEFNVQNNVIFRVNGKTGTITLLGNDYSYGEEGKIGTLLEINASKGDGDVVLILESEATLGNIHGNKETSLVINLKGNTSYTGAINGNKKMGKVSLRMLSSTRWILNGDTYLTAFRNDDAKNSNVYANGHKLFVNGKEVSINQGEPSVDWVIDKGDGENKKKTETEEKTETPEEKERKKEKAKLVKLFKIVGYAFSGMMIVTAILLEIYYRKKQKNLEKKTLERASKNKMKKPWDKK